MRQDLRIAEADGNIKDGLGWGRVDRCFRWHTRSGRQRLGQLFGLVLD
jgi:hypothetical protein